MTHVIFKIFKLKKYAQANMYFFLFFSRVAKEPEQTLRIIHGGHLPHHTQDRKLLQLWK